MGHYGAILLKWKIVSSDVTSAVIMVCFACREVEYS